MFAPPGRVGALAKRRGGSPRLAERAVVTKPAKPYLKGAYQTRRPHRAKNGEGDEVEMAEKYRRRFPAHIDDRAACIAASYLMLRDLWNEALDAAAAGKNA
jgi:hypothetical protein